MSEFLNDTAVVTGGEARSGKVETFTVDLPTKQGKSWSRISLVPVALVALTALAAGLVSSLLTDASFRGDFGWISAAAIFVSSYVALAIGRVPGLGLDRAGITLVGAAMMVACGALPLDQAYAAVDLDTLTLLLGMMIVVAHLRLSGFLTLATVFIARRTHHPFVLLAAIIATAGVLSAFLVNDAICLVLTPLVIDLARSSRRNPVPYLLAVAMSANVGSTAAITGNPQNMIVGSLSHIAYSDFTTVLAPVALVGLVLIVLLILLFHHRELAGSERLDLRPMTTCVDRVMVFRAVAGATALLTLLFAGQPPAKAAIVIAALLLLKPFVTPLPDHRTAWLTVAMASTLAGNLTLLGSIANLIVVQGAATSGVQVGFWDHFKVGAPLTLMTLMIGTLWLWL